MFDAECQVSVLRALHVTYYDTRFWSALCFLGWLAKIHEFYDASVMLDASLVFAAAASSSRKFGVLTKHESIQQSRQSTSRFSLIHTQLREAESVARRDTENQHQDARNFAIMLF